MSKVSHSRDEQIATAIRAAKSLGHGVVIVVLDDDPDTEVVAALRDLWHWASVARTDLTIEPVPDGLGAKVIAALEKADSQ